MNAIFLEVLKEVWLGLLIMEPNVEGGRKDQKKKMTRNLDEGSELEWIWAV